MITLFRVLPILVLCINGSYSDKPILRDRGTVYQTISYNCAADLNKGDLLSLYQIKQEGGSEPILMHRVQHTTNTSQNMNFDISWTLELSDNGSTIYCAKHSVVSPEGKLSEAIKSDLRSYVVFHRQVTPKKDPFVTITPGDSIKLFATNENQTFICRGSEMVDGRELTWYIQEPNTKPKLANNQTFNVTANVNHLELRFDETYNCKKLFCAQDFHLIRIPTDDGTVVIDRYRKLARSNMTLLRMVGKEDCDVEQGNRGRRPRTGEIDTAHENNEERADRDGPASSTSGVLLVAAVPVAMVLLLLINAGILRRCRRRSETDTQTNNSTDEIDVTCSPVTEGLGAKISDFPASEATEKQRSTEATYAAFVFPPPTTGHTEAELKVDPKVPTEVTYAALEFSAPPAANSARLKRNSCAYAAITVPPADLRRQADLAQPKQTT